MHIKKIVNILCYNNVITYRTYFGCHKPTFVLSSARSPSSYATRNMHNTGLGHAGLKPFGLAMHYFMRLMRGTKSLMAKLLPNFVLRRLPFLASPEQRFAYAAEKVGELYFAFLRLADHPSETHFPFDMINCMRQNQQTAIRDYLNSVCNSNWETISEKADRCLFFFHPQMPDLSVCELPYYGSDKTLQALIAQYMEANRRYRGLKYKNESGHRHDLSRGAVMQEVDDDGVIVNSFKQTGLLDIVKKWGLC